MPCPDCNDEKVDCGCIQEGMHINQICNPINCDTEECSESFSANCIIYSDDDLVCNDVVLATAGDSIAQITANISAYFCNQLSVTDPITCNLDEVVPADTSMVDAIALVTAYFCNAIDNITLTPGPQGVGIATIVWTSNSGSQPQGTQGTTDTYTITLTDASTSTFVVTNGADGADGINGTNGTNGNDGQSVDHTSLTATTGGAGSLDTYTIWGDVGETINLGTFNVQNGIDGTPNQVILDIGAWDMDATGSLSVAHGQTFSDIRNTQVFIRDDDGNFKYNLEIANGAIQGYFAVGNTNVDLTRVAAGLFDDPSFSGTGATRGWIIIDLV